MSEPIEVPIISGHCNPQGFELSAALMTSAEKNKLVAFAVEKHPFFENMRSVALLVQVKGIEHLHDQVFKISGSCKDQDNNVHLVEVEYSLATMRGSARIFS